MNRIMNNFRIQHTMLKFTIFCTEKLVLYSFLKIVSLKRLKQVYNL